MQVARWVVCVVVVVLGLGSLVSPTGAVAEESSRLQVSAVGVSVGSVVESVDAVVKSAPTELLSSKDASDGVSGVEIPGGILGRVIGDDGVGVADVAVTIQDFDSGVATTAFTDAGGKFSGKGLTPGRYFVRTLAEGDRAGGLSAQAVTVVSGEMAMVMLSVHTPPLVVFDDAGTVPSTAGGEQGGGLARADIALLEGGSISGTVTDQAGSPIAFASVSACPTAVGSCGNGPTGLDGRYQIDGLAAGDYTVAFFPPLPGYADAYAGVVSVATGAVTSGIDAVLGLGGSVSGIVTDGSGSPMTGVQIIACLSVGANICLAEYTGVDGSYQIDRLKPGSYSVEFNPPTPYAPVTTFGVGVVAGAVTSGIDVILTSSTSGSISGTVTDEAGSPIAGVEVFACPFIGGANCGDVNTGLDGSYRIDGLAAGDFRLNFNPSGPYVEEYFDGTTDVGSATPVSVTAGAVTSDINASLGLGGSIAGTVTGEAGSPIAGIGVYACTSLSIGGICGATQTGTDGSYQIDGLTAGDFLVQFSALPPYVSEYFDDSASFIGATPVSVTAGSVTSGINASLALGGSISGTVTDEAGSPIAGVDVFVCPFTGAGFCGGATTGTAGSYQIDGLAAGDFIVQFSSPGGYLSEYFDDATDQGSATAVSVTAGMATSGIDAVLAVGGSISGTVTDEVGAPIAGVSVIVCPLLGGGFCESAWTVGDGSYQVDGLADGDVVVQFGGSGPYVSEFYDDATEVSAATPVSVAAGAVTAGIDAVLAVGGSISGMVTDEAGSPVVSVYVSVCPFTGGGLCGGTITGPDGAYQVDGLASGDFRVQFNPDYSSPYAWEWFDDVTDPSLVTPVTVVAGAVTSGIDAALGLGGSIAGTVKNAAGDGIANVFVVACTASDQCGGFDTLADGTYQINNLQPGDYKVNFGVPVGSPYVGEWYDDTNLESATWVTVDAGAVTSGIDAVLATAAVPANDDVVDAGILAGPSGSVAGSNVSATGELGEVSGSCHADSQLNSVWWSWTAPVSGSFVVDTFGSGFDTTLAVYSGSVLPTLAEELGCNDDSGDGLQSSVSVEVTAGVSYLIRVDGSNANTGVVALNFVLTPSSSGSVWSDFDGDGLADRSVWRPDVGGWYVDGQATAFLGLPGDVPVPADYDGDAITERAVFRDGAWFIEGQATQFLGAPGDIPVPGDYDGNGTIEVAVFRDGAWFIGDLAAQFLGSPGDVPVPADYDGDGITEIAVFRPSVGGWYVDGAAPVFYGLSSDVPVPADYDGDGAADRAVYRPEFGGWYVDGQATEFIGLSTDVPVPADYDGDNAAERAVYRPEFGGWYVQDETTVFYGLGTDTPLPLPAAVYTTYY